MKGDFNEKLLQSWLRLSTAISNERIVSDLPYNESLICHILYRQHLEHPGCGVTATDLCRETRILKSQMNRTLGNMESKGLIVRERSEKDKRQVFVRFNPEQIKIYEEQHQKILNIIDELIIKIGKEKAGEAMELFNLVADTAEEVIK